MEAIFDFIDDLNKRLQRPIKDLDDIRFAMQALKQIREEEIRIDMQIGPIEESYATLVKHELPVPREEAERVDTLRYSWQKMTALAFEVSNHLIEIQPNFKSDLIDNVQTFVEDTNKFYDDYRVVSGHPSNISSPVNLMTHLKLLLLLFTSERTNGGRCCTSRSK